MPCDKKELLEFVSRWQGRGYEKGDTQQFWLQLLRTIGYPKVDDVLFEYHVSSGGFIDVWIPDAGVLVTCLLQEPGGFRIYASQGAE